ncbi:MAG TPA: DUF2007 domain-containing protein [Caulobacterales bacterium]|nr:DUF2007 domain-containing protein [Caulobacterales bacterium]
MDLVVAARFIQRSEALIANSLLEAEGVYTLMPDLNVLSIEPGFAFTQSGFRIMVRADQAERARAILRDAQMQTAAADG